MQAKGKDMNHSPGPWKASKYDAAQGRTRWTIMVPLPGRHKAMTGLCNLFPMGWEEDGVDEANARLIAESPAMLEVVKAVRDLASGRDQPLSDDLARQAEAILLRLEDPEALAELASGYK